MNNEKKEQTKFALFIPLHSVRNMNCPPLSRLCGLYPFGNIQIWHFVCMEIRTILIEKANLIVKVVSVKQLAGEKKLTFKLEK